MEYLKTELVDLKTVEANELDDSPGWEVVAVIENSELTVVNDEVPCGGGSNGMSCSHGYTAGCSMTNLATRHIALSKPMFLVGRSVDAHKIAERNKLEDAHSEIASLRSQLLQLQEEVSAAKATIETLESDLVSERRALATSTEHASTVQLEAQKATALANDATASKERLSVELARLTELQVLGVTSAVEGRTWMTSLQVFIFLREHSHFVEDYSACAQFFTDALKEGTLVLRSDEEGTWYRVNDYPDLLARLTMLEAVGRLTSQNADV